MASPKFLLFLVFLMLSWGYAEDTTEEVKKGHSHNGHAFNEGPRQSGPLLGNTGEVHLSITSSWDQGQAYFNQGLGQLHGFWYYEAERSFRTLLAKDPKCLMAYWGLSRANFENPKRAKEFIEKAINIKKEKKVNISAHEKAYLDAEIAYHDDKKQKDIVKRRQKLIRDYENIILDYPDDMEAKALMVCQRWQFMRKGIPIYSYVGLDALLEQIFSAKPNHPAHHYAIHLWDYRRHQEALDSAALLSSTAPAIAHMWHMPGHIYSKSKRFQDAAWHQQASARIDHAHMQKWLLLPDQIHNYAHNNEWLARNLSNLGEVQSSITMAKSLVANPKHPKLNTYAKRMSSYRYGRNALIKLLENAELWDQAIRLCESAWLEPLPKPEEDLSRMRLLGVSQFHLDQTKALEESIQLIRQQSETYKGTLYDMLQQTQTKAIEEKKTTEEIKALAKKTTDLHKGKMKTFEKVIAELEGYLAAANGNLEAAKKALGKHSPSGIRMNYYFKFGQLKEAEKEARKQIAKKDKKAIPLAQAVHILHQMKPGDKAVKKGFEELRSISSRIDLKSPVFARLSPIAEQLKFSPDWRLHNAADNRTKPQKDLNKLGPLYWSPPNAPSFKLFDQHGRAIGLDDFRGKPLVLIFYLGAGCLHCTEQLTAMADRHHDFNKAQLPILAISTDNQANLKKSQQNYSKGDIPFSIISNSDKQIFKKYTAYDDFENEPLHGTFIIDSKGRILWSDISADPFMDIDFLITEATRLLELHK